MWQVGGQIIRQWRKLNTMEVSPHQLLSYSSGTMVVEESWSIIIIMSTLLRKKGRRNYLVLFPQQESNSFKQSCSRGPRKNFSV
jgi:hypothetical protein